MQIVTHLCACLTSLRNCSDSASCREISFHALSSFLSPIRFVGRFAYRHPIYICGTYPRRPNFLTVFRLLPSGRELFPPSAFIGVSPDAGLPACLPGSASFKTSKRIQSRVLELAVKPLFWPSSQLAPKTWKTRVAYDRRPSPYVACRHQDVFSVAHVSSYLPLPPPYSFFLPRDKFPDTRKAPL